MLLLLTAFFVALLLVIGPNHLVVALFSSSSTTNIFGLGATHTPGGSGEDGRRYIVLRLNRLGLANRLRAMADWHAVAALSSRSLLVSWEPTADCNASFTDLFRGAAPGVKILPFFLPSGREGLEGVHSIALKANLTAAVLSDVQDTGFLISKKHIDSSTQVLITDNDGLIAHEDVKCQQYLYMHSSFLRALVPTEYAQRLVHELKLEYFSKQLMIGVHVRVHDPDQDWAVVPPLFSDPSSKTAVNFGVGASLESFVTYMREIEYAFHGNARFFVASNDAQVKSHLLTEFPTAVALTSSRNDSGRGSVEGVTFALVEWLALSESSLILNTYGSSFAAEAAARHMRPLAGLWDGLLLHHNNPHLPFCGHLLFAKHYSSEVKDMIYTEVNDARSFERTIAGKEVSMAPCSLLEGFGLSRVYCVQSN